MDAELNRAHLEALAKRQGRVIIEDPHATGSYALVTPNNAGKGTDPRGEKGAALAFADGVGMSLQDVADVLYGRAD